MSPIVSVLLPVFNGGGHLIASLESILDQSFDNFELVVVDDGSTDGTAEILRAYAKRDPRITIFQQPNMGIVQALNKGLTLSRGRYIARMDADDIAARDRLKIQVAFMEANKSVVACGTNYVRFGSRRGLIRTPASDAECRGVLAIESCFAHPTVMLKSAVLTAHSVTYREDSQFSEDYRLWSELAQYGELGNIQQILLKYRVHNNQISVQKRATQRMVHAQIAEANLGRAGIRVSKGSVGDILWPGGRGVEAAIRYLQAVKRFTDKLQYSDLNNSFLAQRISRIKKKNVAKILVGVRT